MNDVLIVGAGSAGSVLAERLSSDPACAVTVLEGGPGLDDPGVRALTGDAAVLPIGERSPVVRHYRTQLTEHPARTADLVRGACVGGSGAVNGGYFWRADPVDFGAVPGWSWDEVVGHFDAVEARIRVQRVTEFSTTTAGFATAAGAAGYGSELVRVPLNIAAGRRLGPGVVFLDPVLGRPNLSVQTGTRVTRLRFAGHRATGVEAIGPDGAVTLPADRVVLCAGAIGSAQLLMLSGIGPAGLLRNLDIDVRADLPVGQRCWDHPEWLLPTSWPAAAGRPVLEAVLARDPWEIRPYTTGFGAATTNVGVALMRPRARGRVSLATADPTAPPRIEHRYDTEPDDLAALRRGTELVREMLSGATALGEPVWSTSQHLAGTAPMGTDEHAVVDPRLRVRGVDNLWVADGSVLPAPLGRGPHATIAMLGHRAAEFLAPRST